jgi:hypothetical protein
VITTLEANYTAYGEVIAFETDRQADKDIE